MSNSQKKLISYQNYTGMLLSTMKFQQALQSALFPVLFHVSSMQELRYEALKRLKETSRTVKNTPVSIESHIMKVLAHFGMDKLDSDDVYVSVFDSYLVGFDKIPIDELTILKSRVLLDLTRINTLIGDYERLAEVQAFLNEKEKSNSHETKTIKTFYVRCLKERQIILDYYLDGIYSRAISRSRANLLRGSAFDINLDIFEMSDYPYHFGKAILRRNYDYRKIDCVAHRLQEIPFESRPEFYRLYSGDKDKFYSKLFRKVGIESIFKNIRYNIEHLPLSDERKNIFKELERLFRRKDWLPFYSLALPQIEGLFAEMIFTNPAKTPKKNALPDKVDQVRPLYESSDSYFDYYQFVLPEQRNMFSHTGSIDNVKLRAFDLLTDLDHLMGVFADLEDPYVKITKLLKRRKTIDFMVIDGFVSYSRSLSALHHSHRTKLKTEIEEFNSVFIPLECSLIHHVKESINEFLEKKAKVIELAKSYIEINNLNFDDNLREILGEIDPKRIQRYLKHLEDEVEKIDLIEEFMKGAIKMFKINSIQDLSQEITVWANQKNFFTNLYFLKTISKKGPQIFE